MGGGIERRRTVGATGVDSPISPLVASTTARSLDFCPRRFFSFAPLHSHGAVYIIADTTWATVRDTDYDVAVLPWGSTEAYNYHLPYATDTI